MHPRGPIVGALLVWAAALVIALSGVPIAVSISHAAAPHPAGFGEVALAPPARPVQLLPVGDPAPRGFGPNALVAERPAYSGHYYVGAQYVGSNTTATDVSVNIATPQDQPQSGDFYYVLVSIWDSAGSYDQLGFTNSNGTWGLAYSWTGPCASVYTYSPNAMALASGTEYHFDMQLQGGDVDFSVSPVGAGPIWTNTAHTGATNFVVANEYGCNGGASLDYTDYEEVYDTTAPVPPYEFPFTSNNLSSTPVTAWSSFLSGTAPTGPNLGLSGSDVTIENVPFALAAPTNVPMEVGTTNETYTTNVTLTKLSSGPTLVAVIGSAIPSATVTAIPSSLSAPGTIELVVNLTSVTPGATSYAIEVELRETGGSSPAPYGRIEIFADVAATLVASVPSASPAVTDTGLPVTVSELAHGGSGSDTYNWSGVPAGCAADLAQLLCTWTTPGNYSISVGIRDSFGFVSHSSPLLLIVHGTPSVSLSPSQPNVDVGESFLLTAVGAGGSPSYSYAWNYPLGTSCFSSGAVANCSSPYAGPLVATVVLTDAAGAHARASTNLSAVSDPLAHLSATPSLVAQGSVNNLSMTVVGGLPGYDAVWIGAPAGCEVVSALTMVCTWPTAGNFTIRGHAVDAAGYASADVRVNVTVVPSLEVVLSVSPAALLAGTNFALTASTRGGYAPYTYTWTGLPGGCAPVDAPVLDCAPSGSGTFVVTVSVSDGLLDLAQTNLSVTIGSSLFGLPVVEGGALIAGASVVLLGLLVAAYWWSRRPRPPRRPPARAPPEPEGDPNVYSGGYPPGPEPVDAAGPEFAAKEVMVQSASAASVGR